MYQSKTLRRMPTITRKLAKNLNEAEKSIARLKKLIPIIQSQELETLAWNKRQEHYRQKQEIDPLDVCNNCEYKVTCKFDGITPSPDCPIHWKQNSILSKVTKGTK